MDRRRFLQGVAVATAGIGALPTFAEGDAKSTHGLTSSQKTAPSGLLDRAVIDTEGYTFLCSFNRGSEGWKVFEDLRTRDGMIAFVRANGSGKILTRNVEATFADANPPHLGLSLRDI